VTGPSKKDPGLERIERARIEAGRAKKRLSSTLGALQYRLKPATLANDAWNGVKEKSGELGGTALQAVKDRPVTASGVVAGLVLFLAREPLWSVVSSYFGKEKADEGFVTADLHTNDEKYDLAAPPVAKSVKQGVSA
jgi:hypothetical protein